MIFHEFPDLSWLKNQINSGFSNRRGWGNQPLGEIGFPSVIINTTTSECFRPDVKGPLSLFLNLRGTSLCTVDRDTRVIEEGSYFISNRSQSYTLQIEKSTLAQARSAHKPVETFNIHFGEYFAESVLNALVTPADRILDNGGEGRHDPVSFIPQLYRRSSEFDELIRQIRVFYKEHGFSKLPFEEQLSSLLVYLLQQQRQVMGIVEKLPPVNRSTRIELYKRLSYSIDLIHSSVGKSSGNNIEEKLDLENLSATACLSKYHYLRLFKTAFGLTPHQYIQDLRMEKARDLLVHTVLPVADLAESLGFVNSQSFSRLFFQRMGIYPSRFREQAK